MATSSPLLVLNFGTATLKFAVFPAESSAPLHAGTIDAPQSAEDGLRVLHGLLPGVLPIHAVAHRVVHGGNSHAGAAFLDAALESEIEAILPLAPQHNRLALDGLRAARALWPGVPQLAVFDTAFHAGMPQRAACYAVPAAWREAGLRRYGFHGLSHQHVMEAVAARMGVPATALRIVSCHLGNGASVCAIANGRSVDTSMGLTPLEGLIMGTRCGDLDPGAIGYVARTLRLALPDIEEALYEKSGMAALAGQGGDLGRIEAAAAAGDADAESALDAYAYRIRKYIGAYAAAMEGCDAVAFTGGVGEHSASIRARVMRPLGFLGLHLDDFANAALSRDPAGIAEVQAPSAPGRIFVVQAGEEAMIAREARRLLAHGAVEPP